MLCSLAQCHQCLFANVNIRVHSIYYNHINVLLMLCHSGMINNIDTESTKKTYENNNLRNDNKWKSLKRRLL